ncbi:MAG: hypothetical protein LBQ10_09060 [Desulfovibrio sp.]|nr:hypothetical protein [Desulfovibrio sp.]
MLKLFLRPFFLPALFVALLTGCNSYQPTKDVWKGTKNFWNVYVSPAAEIDYEEKGALSPSALELTNSMMGVDRQLSRLERVMINADRPPTKTWVSDFMSNFPWLNGFAGVKYDGTILGQVPSPPLKQLDFIPLLYEDKKQSNRALRADVQNTPLGPETMLAVPLYDNADFLGVVVAHFDMRTLAQFTGNPANIVILSPQALLWPGKYDYAATPLAGVNWEEVVSKSSSGVCKNAAGSFYYIVRYFANLPLVFAVPESGSFPEGDGNPEQGGQFFPKEAKKLPPPPVPERKSRKDMEGGQQLAPPAAANTEAEAQPQPSGAASAHDIQPGSSESVLLKNQAPRRRQVQERKLEGEDVPVERAQRPLRAPRPPARQETGHGEAEPPVAEPLMQGPTLPGGRPSPFGPRGEDRPRTAPDEENAAPAPRTPEPAEIPLEQRETDKPVDSPQPDARAEPEQGDPTDPQTGPPATSGGRPSPFGPRE